MASIKKPAIAIAVLIVAGGVAALSAPILNQRQVAKNELSAFGIKSTESVFGYQRQSGWREVAPRLYAVSPPRQYADFQHYAVQYDPDTNNVCGVSVSI